MFTIVMGDKACEKTRYKNYIAEKLDCNDIMDGDFDTGSPGTGLEALQSFITGTHKLKTGGKTLVLTRMEVPEEWVELPGVVDIWGWEDFVVKYGLPASEKVTKRIPVSMIDPDADELSEAKGRIRDLVMQLDQKDADLSSLLQSNNELTANNARCKEEIDLLNGEIRKMQETNDYGVAGYELLAKVLQGAYNQAATGKGKERHANNLPFHEQKMLSITHQLASPIGLAYQVIKKVEEALGLPTVERQVSELYGAINYTAGIIIYLESRQPTTTEGQR